MEHSHPFAGFDMDARAQHESRSGLAAPRGDVEAATRVAVLDAPWPLAGIVVFAAILMALLAALSLPPQTIHELMQEGGPVENASVVWYAAALAAAWLVQHPAFDKTSAAATSVLLVACVAKEISLRRELLAAAGYEPCCSPLTAWPNLMAAALVLTLLPAAAWLLWRYSRLALESLRRRRPLAVTLAVAFFCIAASQLAERIQKIDGSRPGLVMSSRALAAALSLEEVLEMMFPVLIVIAALQVGVRVPAPRRRHEGHSDPASRSDEAR